MFFARVLLLPRKTSPLYKIGKFRHLLAYIGRFVFPIREPGRLYQNRESPGEIGRSAVACYSCAFGKRNHRVLVRVCVCVCVFLHDNSKRSRSRNTKLENIVVYENSSDEFAIELRRIKVTVGVQKFSTFTTIQTVRSYSSTLVQARNLILSMYVHLILIYKIY